ncbi:MAG: DegT/DnrJ/EryC1/StrS family aminotransferase [Oscillospiraceae bacterium]|nr:DegT/DnrJ/EryC1/StrS family aminotransferase [Oscillospiraceae bacterium]MBQ7129792.1 DegT/DnrJ/EryC1/StrS family aminotransferase [Oscillospiraceae bacterium]
MDGRIWLSSPTMHGEEMEFIREAFVRNWVAPVGFNCDGFEQEMLQYLYGDDGKNHQALALSSCTAALHLAVKLAGVQRGDVVFCSDLTFVAAANAICYEGGIPVFVDCEEDTWNMDPEALEKAFAKYPGTKAVVLIHLYGVPAKIGKIRDICRRNGALLIEDAAEALGASLPEGQCGTFGDFGTISFNGNKIITTSGGGILICHGQEERERALSWATQSRERVPWYQHEQLGYNYRLSNICAGIGRGQLRHLEEHRARKKEIYHIYQEAFRELPVTMNPWLPDTQPNFWLSCLTVNRGCAAEPGTLLSALEMQNMEGRHIWKPMHLQPLFADRDFIKLRETAVGADIFLRGLCLPSDIKMTRQDQQRVIDTVKGCF